MLVKGTIETKTVAPSTREVTPKPQPLNHFFHGQIKLTPQGSVLESCKLLDHAHLPRQEMFGFERECDGHSVMPVKEL